MSVYTQLDTQDFISILKQYDLGKFITFEGIAAGIENTNYKITLEKSGETVFYFLTIFEHLKQSDLDFFMPLLAHLETGGCQLASPVESIHGDFIFTVKKKDAALFHCLPGKTLETTSAHHCHIIGQQLAKIHLAASSFKQSHDNSRGFYWLQKQINNDSFNLSNTDRTLMLNELAHLQECWKKWGGNSELNKGFIHADLFPDNSLFTGDKKLSGVIDFYAGGSDYWVYDLAICIMAWCQTEKAEINTSLETALIKGYEEVRTLTDTERQALPNFMRLAVLRFWVSRLLSQEQQQGAALTTFKDPDVMKDLLISISK